jgi:hypothetical protein
MLRFTVQPGGTEFAEKHDIPGTVGSDAHAAFELGRSLLLLDPFEGPDGMRKVIRKGIPKRGCPLPWVHLSSRYAVMYKAFTKVLTWIFRRDNLACVVPGSWRRGAWTGKNFSQQEI